jgi:hypothetical protein
MHIVIIFPKETYKPLIKVKIGLVISRADFFIEIKSFGSQIIGRILSKLWFSK